jgi:gliding motility-associated-like protein
MATVIKFDRYNTDKIVLPMRLYIQRLIFINLIYCASLMAGGGIISAQVLNDDCQFATPIPSSDNYCSAANAFTNIGAKADNQFLQANVSCVSLKWANGVWFSFVPRQPAVLIRVLGFGNGGTLRSPKIVLFQRCGQYVSCSPGKDVGIDELVYGDLNIGQTYFIMVESSIGGEGTFGLCIDDFVPVSSPESDCRDAVILCDKSPFVVDRLIGSGNDKNELDPNICIGGEFASAWYKWTCDVPGRLTFTLTPNNNINNQISDDIDFALYELSSGIDNCGLKKLLRCEGAGANTDAVGNVSPLAQWAKCNGPTGLREGESDLAEPAGCVGNNNNFVAPIDMEAGKSYALIINNFSRSGLGFGIEFGGTGTFLGPKPDFEINANKAFECDKSIVFNNKSTSATDPIVNYTWNFGDKAIPERQSGQGPYDVTYLSFGDKIAALTVKSSRGCVVTKIKEFFVDACCKDTTTLKVNVGITDLKCFNIPEGKILASASGGLPDYKFRINNGKFNINPLFGKLDTGTYIISVQDTKGCVDSITRTIGQPPKIVINAGDDQEIDFGNTTFLNGSFTSFNGVDTLVWMPEEDFEINGVTNPEVFPKTTTDYILSLVDKNGCVGRDTVVVRVIKDYKIHAPNIFTPDESGYNDFFNIWTTKGVKYIELLEVYDRWGNLVYQGTDIKAPSPGELVTGDAKSGWNGIFHGKPVVAGVYTWRAKVRFIDEELKIFAGDITLLR